MKLSATTIILVVILLLSFCSYGSLLMPEYATATPTLQVTRAPVELPTQTPFLDATKITELVMETSSVITPESTNTVTGFSITGAECVPTGSKLEGQVSRVLDGATIQVLVDDRILTVRYIGIDTSESVLPDQPPSVFGPDSLAKNKALTNGENVTLYTDVSVSDGYGRLLAYVFVGDEFINYEMIRSGYAYFASYPPDVSCSEMLQQAEQAAQRENAGLWSASG